ARTRIARALERATLRRLPIEFVCIRPRAIPRPRCPWPVPSEVAEMHRRFRAAGFSLWLVPVWLSFLGLVGACARPQTTAPPQSVASESTPVCAGLVDRFVGLPAALEGDGEAAGHERAPLVGSWWVRSCTTTRNGSELSVNLAGPGWYWVDAEQDGFTMHQQVGLELSAELAGTLQAGFASGIVSVWFR